MTKKVRQLAEQFVPKHYDLELVPDREAMKFSGRVVIKGEKIGRPSQRLTFHQHDLKILSAKVTRHDRKGNQEFDIDRLNTHNRFDEVRLHSKAMLYPGQYTVTLEFTGTITKPMNGIYPCYFKHNDQEKMLIATQFESHHAREAFPCIDEPGAKALFDLTLTTPKGESVIANTPIKKQTARGATVKTEFETTPKMSTYLLAFVYGELHSVGGTTKHGVKVRSWATVAQPKTHLTYANKEAIAVLDFFEDYFKTPFPLPKLDQVALPDFDSLAMENWGLITFREVGLLADPRNRSISGERLITQVVAHELSHQWFGNLVTMKWWDDLWLNESFATIMESLAPDKLHPDWQEWEDFASSRIIGAANRDVYKDVQPIGVRVTHPDEILSLFDPAIVYAKGARVLKMLFDFIGEGAFRNGLAQYFVKHAYGNTSREDLWKELSLSSGLDIETLMTPWIEQSGTPELMALQHGNKLTLTQQRFLLDGEDVDAKWPIPLLADTKLSPSVLTGSSVTIELPSEVMPMFNPAGSGHFITRYKDTSAQDNVYKQIKNRLLPSSGRIIALSDMLLQTQKGQQSLTDLLRLTAQCNHEDRDAVWSMFARIIGSVQLITDDNKEIEDKLKEFKRELASYWYKRLGWEDQPGDDPNTKNLRTTAIALSVGGENQPAIDIALAKFATAESVEALPAEQRGIIAGAAVRFGKPEYIKQLMTEYETSHNPDVKDSIAAALCSTRDEKVAEQLVTWGMNNENIIRVQDIDHWFAYLMRSHYTREVAWRWLTNRWGYLHEQFGEGKRMEYFIWYASRPIATKEWQKRYTAFFEPMLDDISLRRNILISFSEIQARVDWRSRDLIAIKKFFKL